MADEWDVFEPKGVVIVESDEVQKAFEGMRDTSKALYQNLKYALGAYSGHSGKVGMKSIEARYAGDPVWETTKKLMAAAQQMFGNTTGKDVPPIEADPIVVAVEGQPVDPKV